MFLCYSLQINAENRLHLKRFLLHSYCTVVIELKVETFTKTTQVSVPSASGKERNTAKRGTFYHLCTMINCLLLLPIILDYPKSVWGLQLGFVPNHKSLEQVTKQSVGPCLHD